MISIIILQTCLLLCALYYIYRLREKYCKLKKRFNLNRRWPEIVSVEDVDERVDKALKEWVRRWRQKYE